jgi:hypothetical protein
VDQKSATGHFSGQVGQNQQKSGKPPKKNKEKKEKKEKQRKKGKPSWERGREANKTKKAIVQMKNGNDSRNGMTEGGFGSERETSPCPASLLCRDAVVLEHTVQIKKELINGTERESVFEI